jgi:hypothetical protein
MCVLLMCMSYPSYTYFSFVFFFWYLGEEFIYGTYHLTCKGGVMVICFVQNFFSDNTRVRIIFFFLAKREIFSHNLTLGYMTKTLNQIIFFFLHQNHNIFFSNIENQNIFLENYNPPAPTPMEVKWSVPKCCVF